MDLKVKLETLRKGIIAGKDNSNIDPELLLLTDIVEEVVDGGSGLPLEKGVGDNSVQQKSAQSFVYHEGQSDERVLTLPEGVETSAIGDNSVAIGIATFAEGQGAYAEGHVSVGDNDELEYTTSSGRGSHAEGCGTKATDSGAHSEGYKTQAMKGASHAEGQETIAEGYHSHAEGYKTHAKGTSSHAEGQETIALKDNNHAEGDRTAANGIASHAEGRVSKANGDITHAEGYYTEADGHYSHSEGYYTEARGNRSHAEGNKSITDSGSTSSHAEGESTLCGHVAGHTEGYKTVCAEQKTDAHLKGTDDNDHKYGHAEGDNTLVTAHAAHAEGLNTWAGGKYGHTEGWDTEVYNCGGHAEGHSTLAGNDADWTPNPRTTNQPEGWFTHAEGDATNAKGFASHAEGLGTQTRNVAEHACGKWNVSNHNGYNITIFSIGIGDAENNRKNAIEVTDTGDVYIYGVNGYTGKNITKALSLGTFLNSLKLTIQTTSNTTIATTKSGNVSVPKLTVDDVTKAYNQIVSGGTCTITDATGNYHLVVNQADSLNGSPSIGILYYNSVALTYEIEEGEVVIHFTEL